MVIKMKKQMEIIKQNKNWGGEKNHPYLSVITPIYNRRLTIKRTIYSIERQSFRNFEYILIDDGSTESADDIIYDFMRNTEIPVLYIKKKNGGVHTARNRAIICARGELLVNVDSDDELQPNALETFYRTWESIPNEERSKYREIVAQCSDQNGARVGTPFPKEINSVEWNEAIKMCEKTKGEHIGCYVTKIMQKNLWPEPDEVTFVAESILWKKLESMYRSYFINDMVRIYHTNTEGSYTNNRIHDLQFYINTVWDRGYRLNHWEIYKNGKQTYLRTLFTYCTYAKLIKRQGKVLPISLDRKKMFFYQKLSLSQYFLKA